MPVKTNAELADLQEKARAAVTTDPARALNLLLREIPEGRAKHDQTLVLLGRNNDILDHEIGNTLPENMLGILRNELRRDILVFINHLTLADFGPKPANRPELKPGHLLYKVPPVMKLRKAHECVVRIAHQLNQVLEGIKVDESVGLEQITVSEVMQVEVIDASGAGDPAFEVLLLSDGEQFVDAYSATEWVFNVRPLRPGNHKLALKISVLLTVNGKERTKNIVHQRAISVRAEADRVDTGFVRPIGADIYTESPTPFPDAPVAYPSSHSEGKDKKQGPNPDRPTLAPAPAPPRRSNLRRYLSVAATVLLIVTASFWISRSLDFGDSTSGPGTGAADPNIVIHPPFLSNKDSSAQDTFAPTLPPELRRDSL